MLIYANGVVYAEKSAGRVVIGLKGFFITAFLLSWIGAAPMVLASWLDADAPEQWRRLLAQLAPLQLLMVFGTLVAALIATTVNYGFAGLKSLVGAIFRFRVAPIWYVAALLGPAIVATTGLVIARQIDPSLPPLNVNIAALVGTVQIFGIYLIANTEEFAWRGYALPQLQRSFSPIMANIYLSMIWGVFHTPLFLMKGGHPAGYSLAIFALLVMSLGIIAGYVFNATRGSLLISHLLHQSLNAWGEGLAVFPVMNDGSPWPFRIMVFILAGFGLAAALVLAARRRPGR